MNLDRLPPTHGRSVRKPRLVDVHDNLLSRVAGCCFWFELDTVEWSPVFSVIMRVVWHGAVHAHCNTMADFREARRGNMSKGYIRLRGGPKPCLLVPRASASC